MKTTKAVTSITIAMMKIADRGPIAPVETNWNKTLTAAGSPATIPAKIMIEMPLPMPRSVICSPNHIRNIVPVTREITQTLRKKKPGSMTRPGCVSRATAIPRA